VRGTRRKGGHFRQVARRQSSRDTGGCNASGGRLTWRAVAQLRSIETKLREALGSDVARISAVSGGDINAAWDVTFQDSRRVFVKSNEHSPPRMFQAEAEGLEFLRAGLEKDSLLVVPEVICVGPDFLVLEFLEHAVRRDQAEDLGIGLARMHAAAADQYGAEQPNFIGTLGQRNNPRKKWVDFFREMRLEAQLSLPGAQRLISPGCKRRFETLYRKLEDLLGPEEPPARLHGDLWGGNAFFTEQGPAIFDPAAYGGHREVDLAMMRLFGGFSERTFEAYDATYPLAPDVEVRLEIYKLYPLLVHVNLFGGGYARSVEDILRKLT
jgi:fructosamine-3-kinase